MKYLWYTGQLVPTSDDCPVSILSMASNCRHLLHPGHPRTDVANCPVCVVRQIVEAMRRIAKVWDAFGGPKNQHDSKPKMYFAIKDLWYIEKKRWASIVHVYGEYAEKEREFEKSFPSAMGFLESENIMSCQAALSNAFDCPCMAPGAEVPFVPKRKGRRMRLSPLRGKPNDIDMEDDDTSGPEKSQNTTDIAEAALLGSRPPMLRTEKSSCNASPELGPEVLTSAKESPVILPTPPPSSPQSAAEAPSMEASKASKVVTFSEHTAEPTHREQSEYMRRSPYYKPGRYASVEGSPSTKLPHGNDDFDMEVISDSEDSDESSDESDSDTEISVSQPKGSSSLRSKFGAGLKDIAMKSASHIQGSLNSNAELPATPSAEDTGPTSDKLEGYGSSDSDREGTFEQHAADLGPSQPKKRSRGTTDEEEVGSSYTKRRKGGDLK